MKQTRNIFTYPLPIAQLNQCLIIQNTKSLQLLPAIYSQYQCIANITSPKILRSSQSYPQYYENFGIILQPFHPTTLLPILTGEEFICKNCGLYMNPESKVISIYQFICNNCKQLNQTHIPIHNNDLLLNGSIDINKQPVNIPKRICLLLELSKNNYNNKVHEAIEDVIIALRQSQSSNEIGFVLYNNANIYLIDQTNQTIFKMTALKQNGDTILEDLPFHQNNFFKSINSILPSVFEIITQLMYQSYIYSQCCILIALKYINTIKSVKIPFQICIFATNIAQISKNQQKILTNRINQQNIQIFKKRQKSKLSLYLKGNMSFFIILNNKIPKQYIKELNTKLYRFYNNNNTDNNNNNMKYNQTLHEQIYYDLYHFLIRKVYHNIEINIITSENILILLCPNQCIIEDKSIKNKNKFNHYKYICPLMHSNTNIALTIRVNQLENKNTKIFQQYQKYIIQYQFKYKSNNHIKNDKTKELRLINYIFQIRKQKQKMKQNSFSSLLRYQSIQDETYFYFLLRQTISSYNSMNLKITKQMNIEQYFMQKMKIISMKFYQDNLSISIPKTIQHTFLYAFMIHKKGLLKNQYYKHQIMNQPLSVIVKMIYYRVYQLINQDKLEQQQNSNIYLKNVKSIGSKFKNNSITFVDTGHILYMVIGDQIDQQKLFKNFGIQCLEQITNFLQLPILSTNHRIRQAILQIRQSNECYFLPLKIIRLFSDAFDKVLSTGLYIQEQHKRYMQELWRRNQKH